MRHWETKHEPAGPEESIAYIFERPIKSRGVVKMKVTA